MGIILYKYVIKMCFRILQSNFLILLCGLERFRLQKCIKCRTDLPQAKNLYNSTAHFVRNVGKIIISLIPCQHRNNSTRSAFIEPIKIYPNITRTI